MEETNQKGRPKVSTTSEGKRIVMRVSAAGIIVKLILSLFKLLAGIVAKSGAMLSDAVHSASDIFSTLIVIVGVNIAAKKLDEEHQYGYERTEYVALIILAVVLCVTGIGIAIGDVEKIIGGQYGKFEIPGNLALIAAIVSIVVKEWMYWLQEQLLKRLILGHLWRMLGTIVQMPYRRLVHLLVY